MTIDEMIAVLQAYKEGKQIQYSDEGIDEWNDYLPFHNPTFDFKHYNYRIAPKQMKKIKLLAYFTGTGLSWYAEGTTVVGSRWFRVPSEDKEITLEE